MTLSEEQKMLSQAARDFLAVKCPKSLVREVEKDERGYRRDLWSEIAGLGWTGLIIPESYGGSGMGFLALAVLLEEMGRACFPGPFFSTVILGALPIMDAGSEQQKRKYLPLISSGEAIFTLALTEEDGLYEPGAVQTRATADGEGFLITGKKLFVPDAHVADYILCAARTDAAEEGISLFIIDAKLPGIRCAPLKTLAGDKLFEMTLEHVRVEKEALLGGFNRGWEIAARTIQKAALAKCCEMLGGIEQVLDMTVDYARERKQFDRPIGSFQVIQHYCAAMVRDVEGARLGVYRAAWALNEGLRASREIGVARAFINDASHRIASLAHQVHGAIGITQDHDLQLYTRRLKAAAATFGSADFYREIVAQEMGL